ncbi:hypothetical protein PVAP13_3NG097420 [Panicum virgatum]|uniref:Uncharacterized protein n=1 Tax=Panicum virgatum TaxID=38727 RepID=A0A8T0U6U3_PANVG|nr:hypothetical protein PVAP13_3NG097420 [Panicum virgatum]
MSSAGAGTSSRFPSRPLPIGSTGAETSSLLPSHTQREMGPSESEPKRVGPP